MMNPSLWLLSALVVASTAQNDFSSLDSQATDFTQSQYAQQANQQLAEEAEQRNYQTVGSYNLDVQNEPYGIDYGYHDYESMTKFLRTTTAKFPTLTALYSIGKSVQGKN